MDTDGPRARILAAAGRILAAEGAGALSMRRLAREVGASTIVLYTHFQDKQEILDGLYAEGFARLEQALAQVPVGEDRIAHVAGLGYAYHGFAQANPTHYEIMFGPHAGGFEPSAASREQALRTFALLHEAVRAVDAHHATERAGVLWGTLHGLISLELLGFWGTPEAGRARIDEAITMLRAGLRPAAEEEA